METKEFRDLVESVRAAQKAYYADKTHTNLVAAKQLEKKLDTVIREWKEAAPTEPEPVDRQLPLKSNSDPLQPPAAVLIALGSIVVHYEELTSPGGHPLDAQAVELLRNDPMVDEWFQQMGRMGRMALLPIKR